VTSLLAGWRARLRTEAPVLVLPLAVALAFVELLAGREILWGDFVSWYFPSHHYAAARLSQGELPLWNPYNDCGMPFMGEADHGTLYPPSLLLHVMGSHKLVLFHLLQAFTLAHILGGALALYALARSLGCRPWAAVVGGLAFGMSGTFMARAAHVSLVCAQAWVPIAIGGLHHAVGGGSRRGLALAAAALGMIALSGSPATAVVAIVGLIVSALATAGVSSDGSFRVRASRALSLLAFVGTAGILLGAVQLLPMRELVEHSERSTYTYEDVSQYALGPQSLILLVWPRFFGWLRYDRLCYWGPENFAELSAYSGAITWIAAVAAIVFLGFRRTAPWIVLSVTGLWLALGAHGGLHRLFYRFVPVLGEMRAPGRFLLLWCCGLAVLAAFGVDSVGDALRENDARGRRFVGGAMLTLAVLAFAALLLWPAELALLEDWQDAVHTAGCRRMLIGLGVTLAALAVARRRPRLAGPVLVAALALDLGLQWQGVGLHPAAQIAEVLGPPPPYLGPSIADPALHRVRSRFTNPGEMMMAHVAVDSGPGRHLRDYEAYRALVTSIGSAAFDLLNVKYVAEPVSPAVSAPGPNLLTADVLWLDTGMETEIPVDPPVRARAVEILLSASADDSPDGTPVGEIEVEGSAGRMVRTVRLGIETGDVSGRHPPVAARPAVVDHQVHVTDAGSWLRAHYRWLVTLDAPQPVSLVRLRNRDNAGALVIKELRLVPADGALDTWRRANEQERPGRLPLRLYENLDVQPRAWLAHRAVTAASPADARRRMREGGLDLRRDVVVEAPVPPGAETSAGGGRAAVTRYSPETIAVQAEAVAPGAWLVLSEVTYPGWMATVDGRPAAVVRADGLFRAVWLPPGVHEVVLSYRPASFYRGAAISALTALVLMVMAAWARRRRAVPA